MAQCRELYPKNGAVFFLQCLDVEHRVNFCARHQLNELFGFVKR